MHFNCGTWIWLIYPEVQVHLWKLHYESYSFYQNSFCKWMNTTCCSYPSKLLAWSPHICSQISLKSEASTLNVGMMLRKILRKWWWVINFWKKICNLRKTQDKQHDLTGLSLDHVLCDGYWTELPQRPIRKKTNWRRSEGSSNNVSLRAKVLSVERRAILHWQQFPN